MYKAILRNRIFVEVDNLLMEQIKKKLTYTIPVKVGVTEVRYVKLYDFRTVNNKTLSIPIGRLDLIPDTHEIVDKRVYNMVDFPISKSIALRPDQQDIYDDVDDNCIVNAGCAFGKTFTGLFLAEKFGQKTLVIVHTKKLQDQWVQETQKVFGIKPGIIGGGKYDIDSDIVIAMKQTLDSKADANTFNEFGTVIIDECLDYNEKIDTKEEGLVRIGKIVNKKLPYHVKSWNGKKFEYKQITNWFKNPTDDWMMKFYFNNRTTLKCTLNHSIYDMYGNKKPAEEFMEGDYVMSDKPDNTSSFIKDNLDILLGCIIGDGSISTRNDNITIKIGHGKAQYDYLDYKYNILKPICKAKICQNTHKAHGSFKETTTRSLSTQHFVDINGWRNKLYTNCKKVKISADICDLLSVESWSLIYMDDGSIDKDKGFIKFHIYMDTEFQELLVKSLYKLFNIKAAIHIRKDVGNFIYLGVGQAKTFIQKIEHLIHPCLDYKKGKWKTGAEFTPIKPIKGFENYTLVKVSDIDFEPAKSGFRYNITVEDNHNYTVSNKLVANCHHASARTFNAILNKFRARYKVGLTATLRRKDQKEFLITNYISHSNIYKPQDGNSMLPEVIAIRSDIMIPGASTWQERVTRLIQNNDYVSLILGIVQRQAGRGHKVLCIGSRVEFLKNMQAVVPKSDLIIGGSVDTDDVIKRIHEHKTEVIFGSTQVMSEGISINPLSCLIYATPFNSDIVIEQTVGRIIRLYEGKLNPIIIDIILKGQTGNNQWRTRKNYYLSKGYKITELS